MTAAQARRLAALAARGVEVVSVRSILPKGCEIGYFYVNGRLASVAVSGGS